MSNNPQFEHEKTPHEVYTVEGLLERLDDKGVESLDVQKLRDTPAHIIASFLSRLSVDECRAVLRKVPEIDASEILAEMDADVSAEIVGAMREWRALRIIEEFDPDDAADILSELDEPDRVRLLSKLQPETALQVRKLLKYKPDTAGGVMTPTFLSVEVDMTVEDAIERIREQSSDDEGIETSHIYVVDSDEKLRGVFAIRALLLASRTQKIADLMDTDVTVCLVNEDKEELARTMAEENLLDLPVVDDQGRLLGIVEHDDVIDIIQEEATEDLQKMVGAGADEAIHDPMVYSIRRRSPWLLVNLLTAVLGATVISFFQEEIKHITLLAVIMPVIVSLSGNTGAQTLAVAIRSIAMGEIEDMDNLGICVKEWLKGIFNGIIIGVVSSLAVYLLTKEVKMAFVVFLAMILNMGLGGLAGAFIPLMLKRLGFDPAQSSSIFLTGTTDVCGFLIFLSLGSWLLF